MAIEKEYLINQSFSEILRNFKMNFLSLLTYPARHKLFLSKQISVLAERFYFDYTDTYTHPKKIYKVIDLLPKNKDLLFIDAGAYIGYISEYFLKKSSNKSKVISIEPIQEYFVNLTSKLDKYNNNEERVFLIKKALNDKKSEKEFYYSKKYTASLTNSKELAIDYYEPEGHLGKTKILTDTLDNLLEDLKIQYENIDLLKIDVEGSEKNVLKGFEKNINKTSVIIIEYGFFNILNDFTLRKIYQLYGDKFYIGKISLAKPYIYISEKYNVEWENFRFIDFILINKDIKNHETANFLLKNSSFI